MIPRPIIRVQDFSYDMTETYLGDYGMRLRLTCCSMDYMQGDTGEAGVIALPEDAVEWSEWLSKPKRVLTTASRWYRQLALPQLRIEHQALIPHMGARVSIQSWRQLQSSSAMFLTWRSIITFLRVRSADETHIWME